MLALVCTGGNNDNNNNNNTDMIPTPRNSGPGRDTANDLMVDKHLITNCIR